MVELTVGKWTNSMLAEWFGIKEKTFKNQKSRKLLELEEYADYYEEKGKIYITDVYVPYYSVKPSNYEAIKDNFNEMWPIGQINTCKNVSYELLEKLDLDISTGTAEIITRKVRTEFYGKPAGENGGSIGSCMYVWCKKDENGQPVSFTKEEEEIKNNLLKKYYGSASEKTVIIQSMIQEGKIKEEEAWSVYKDMMNLNRKDFISFLQELSSAIGATVIKGTILSDKPKNAFLIEE